MRHAAAAPLSSVMRRRTVIVHPPSMKSTIVMPSSKVI